MSDTLAVINLANIQFLLNPPLFIASQTAAQTLATATITALTWPTPTTDVYGMWAAGNPTRITPKVPGYYTIVGSCGFAVNSTNSRSVSIRKNGSGTDINQVTAQANGFNTVIQVVSIVQFNGTTDYVEVYADQISGGNLNTVTGITSVTAQMIHA